MPTSKKKKKSRLKTFKPKLKPNTKYFVIFSAVATVFAVLINVPLIETPTISQVGEYISSPTSYVQSESPLTRISLLELIIRLIKQVLVDTP